MRCPGSGHPPKPLRRQWADRNRFVTVQCCPACGTVRALRKDGKVRVHRWPAVLPVPQPRQARPATRVVTPK